MNNCLSESQLCARDYPFWISMLNKISVTGSLTYVTKVWENLEFAMQSCKAAFSSEEIDDTPAVLRCTAAGSILVL